jgi:hypothetical protein
LTFKFKSLYIFGVKLFDGYPLNPIPVGRLKLGFRFKNVGSDHFIFHFN